MCDYGLFGGEVKPELLNPGPKGKVEMKSKEGAKLGSEGTIGAVKLHATCCNGLGLLNVGSGSGKDIGNVGNIELSSGIGVLFVSEGSGKVRSISVSNDIVDGFSRSSFNKCREAVVTRKLQRKMRAVTIE
ncbi:hypothetical protein Patl1_11614 [Pistacia atlantica]|uniref:Uncharacterized protein n=1 Tax=Pistacia atlantica TaxID=434234 RepID=A0ACC1A5T3_9ROSI|nr:hypothetical protein Patl1_11614 [Pistacia atlantica]